MTVDIFVLRLYTQFMNTPPPKQDVPDKDELKQRMKAISASLIVAVLLMGVKFYTYSITGSAAILSDALESIINVVAAAFAMVSIWLASQPPDKEHPYGHGKIEYFSAGFEGALIILAAIGIFKSGLSHLFNPPDIPNLETGLYILVGTGLVNLCLGYLLIRAGKKTRSLTLMADGKHVITDVYTTAAVIIGLFLVYLTNLMWIDGAVACVAGLNILFTGAKLVRQSFSGLMDSSDPDLLDKISEVLVTKRKRWWLEVHKLRAWRSGDFVHIDLHLVLPKDFSLERAHHEAAILEQLIVDHFSGRAGVLVHMEPCDDPLCSHCNPETCRIEPENEKGESRWNRHLMTMPKREPAKVEP